MGKFLVFQYIQLWNDKGNFYFIMQEPVKLLEYSLGTITEGIDTTATTCVVICKENIHISTQAINGDIVHPMFRYVESNF